MSDTVIKVENLSKRYRLGELHRQTGSFREKVTQAFSRLTHSAKRKVSNHIPSTQDAMPHDFPVGLEDRTEAPCPAPQNVTPHTLNSMQSSQDDSIWALRNVSYEVKRGEIIGIIGRNGAGKSTLLKILSRITKPTKGRALINGRVSSLLEVGTGFHPELTGRENIYLNGAILGMTKADIKNRFDEIVEFSEINKFLDTPVKRYSSGMYVRLAFSVAAHLETEILLIDEVLAVGDTLFQKKCIGKIGGAAQDGRTVLFVSHNLNAVGRLCQRCILLDKGRILRNGNTNKVIEGYLSSGNVVEGFWERPASKPISPMLNILSARIIDLNGRNKGIVGYSSGFSVEIKYRPFLRNHQFIIALRVRDILGNDIFTTWDSDFEKKRITSPGKTYVSHCDIPSYFLRPGTYSAYVFALMITHGRVKTIDSTSVPFEVSVEGYNFNEGRVGILTPLLVWHTKPERSDSKGSLLTNFRIGK